MALILADRVKETSTTAGNGTFTLAGAAAGFQSFAVVGDGNTTYYCIAGQGTNEWEVGIGTYTSSGTTLARTTVLSNSSATEPTALVFAAGTKDVFVTYPSEKSVNLDASGNATALGTPVAFTGTNITGTAAGLTAGAATVLATARNIAGVSFNGSASIAIPLENLSDVSIGTAVVNELLGYNGTAWVNVAPNSASAGTGVVFYNATPVITAAGANNDVALLTFASIPVTTAEQVITGTAVNNTVLFSAFITVALNRLLFDAGIYDFTIWSGVDSIAGGSVTTITRQIYTATPFVVGTVTTTGTGSSRTATASSGTPFATSVIDASATNTDASYLQTPQGLYQITARTSDTVVTITTPSGYTNESAVAGTAWKKLFGVTTPAITSISPNYSELSIYTTQPSTVVTAATKMGILGFVTSDATRTISLTYNGEDRNTHVNTPLANLHNDLAGLQGGVATEYFHSTSAEYTGTGTGVFVRETSPTLVTPDLGTPSALVGTNISGTATAFTSSNVTTNANLTNEATSSGSNAVTLTNSAVIGKVLTGYVSGAGTVAATDTILQAIEKLNGNAAGATGTVTTVSVVSNNGFAGTVATATSTPAITLTTTVTGMLKGSNVSGIVSAATAASDYVAPSAYASANGLTMATARLLGRTTAATGAAEEITVGTGLSLSAGTLSASGGVTTIGFGTTGLTPSAATGGVVTVAGTLAVANGGTGVTSSTGSGANVLGTSPTLVTPVLGAATATTLVVSDSVSTPNTFGFKNLLINAGYTINQRVYVSGAALATTAYGHDRWKAGASGGDYSFTQNASSTTITIAAGKSLIQVVEDKNVNGTSFVLSWTGTAQARYAVNSATPAGGYASSPILITGQTQGTTMSVEFNAGTLTRPQLELGSLNTSFDYRAFSAELAMCQRYYIQYAGSTGFGLNYGAPTINNTFRATFSMPVQMRIAPVINTPTSTRANVATIAYSAPSPFIWVINITSTTTGNCSVVITTAVTLSAEL